MLQLHILFSTIEAEYLALFEIMKELFPFKMLYKKVPLGLNQNTEKNVTF